MPNLFRTADGTIWKPGASVPLELPDGTIVPGVWGGSAKEERLHSLWLRPETGNVLVQSAEVAAIAVKAKDPEEMLWADAPGGARLFFVLKPREAGKDYQLALMVTTAADAGQIASFRHERFALFGKFRADGRVDRIAPLPAPPPQPPAQGMLF